MPDQHIFSGEASDLFYSKLDHLHDEYVYHLIVNGIAPIGSHLESIKMTKNPSVSQKYCEIVVGGLLNTKPQIIAKLLEGEETKIECIFTKINDKKEVNYLYMIQNVMNWPKIDNFSCQIWYLGETSVNQIKKHWL